MANEVLDIPSDEELLRSHLHGDAGSFRVLVDRYSPELFRFLLRFLGRRALTEDVIQETFLQVHVSAATFEDGRRVKPWLFTIAANKARDALRSRARKREVSVEGSSGEDGETGPGLLDVLSVENAWPGEAEEKREEARRVRGVVGAMPDHLREVLVLGYFHQFAYREIAEILDVPIGTVKSRLHAAVNHFAASYREVLEEARPDGQEVPAGVGRERRGSQERP